MKTISTTVQNETQLMAVAAALYGMGYSVYDAPTLGEFSARWKRLRQLSVTKGRKSFDGNTEPRKFGDSLNNAEFIQAVVEMNYPSQEIIKNVTDKGDDGVIASDGKSIKVGCSTVSLEKVNEIHAAMNK